jgi:periplasmic protein TonB
MATDTLPAQNKPGIALAGAVAFGGQATLLVVLMIASLSYVGPAPPARLPVPLPPPAPPPPTEVTDPRVFPDEYSSLPFQSGGDRSAPFTQVIQGVGVYFPPLFDMGRIDRSRNPIRRVWPARALEGKIMRRTLPHYPKQAARGESASVFLEYLICTDGSVRVLRTSGPALFAAAARSALERWEYEPVRFEKAVIEVVSRVEVRFDGELATSSH